MHSQVSDEQIGPVFEQVGQFAHEVVGIATLIRLWTPHQLTGVRAKALEPLTPQADVGIIGDLFWTAQQHPFQVDFQIARVAFSEAGQRHVGARLGFEIGIGHRPVVEPAGFAGMSVQPVCPDPKVQGITRVVTAEYFGFPGHFPDELQAGNAAFFQQVGPDRQADFLSVNVAENQTGTEQRPDLKHAYGFVVIEFLDRTGSHFLKQYLSVVFGVFQIPGVEVAQAQL